ncbi:hypothetical protein PV10_09201 [Exophiala mesophila]|uniref:Geranylgeranyl pyrophosphate synthase n=1 Tax=Exophiala mesophila TaxID=212818 RepID=A0A0D1WGY2_EXOME|nr:uncharacterized protein PV10_09201 [Exophiala mesophila]KIV88025.1 hypothetical protein PV10_09201 [Exophiala mesophila]
MSTLTTENPASPNAIPVRYSSAGYPSGILQPPSKSVLKPLPEESWIAQKQSVASSLSHTPNSPEQTHGLKRRHSTRHSASDTISPRKMGEWSSQKEKIIMGPYDYLFAHPGKDIRAALIKAFDAFLHVPHDSLEVITRVVGMLHTSSLLIDDVQDGSQLRRGVPVAHNIFGTAQTINSANYVYFIALQELQHLTNKDEAIEIFTTELLNLHRGQGMDLYWRDTLTCPTEDDYLEMVQNKTGGLFRLAVKLMQAESPERGRIDCVPLVNLMGLIFQICDDYLNLSSGTYTKNKGLCEDLTEGKFSFPVIHSIRANPSNLQLINILKQKTTDDGVKRYAISYMESTGSFEYSRRVIRELKVKARSLISEMDGGSDKSDEISRILDRMDVDQ